MTEVLNIPELFRNLVTRVDLKTFARAIPFHTYFDYGRYLEIDKRLIQKGLSAAAKSKRFPLVWLVIPFTKSFPALGDMQVRRMQIIICNVTKPNSTTPDRFNENFTNYLWPIYTELMNQISISGYFSNVGENFPHDLIEQPFWDGKETGQVGNTNLGTNEAANMFNDYVDAIQLKNIQLDINLQTCDQFKLIG